MLICFIRFVGTFSIQFIYLEHKYELNKRKKKLSAKCKYMYRILILSILKVNLLMPRLVCFLIFVYVLFLLLYWSNWRYLKMFCAGRVRLGYADHLAGRNVIPRLTTIYHSQIIPSGFPLVQFYFKCRLIHFFFSI